MWHCGCDDYFLLAKIPQPKHFDQKNIGIILSSKFTIKLQIKETMVKAMTSKYLSADLDNWKSLRITKCFYTFSI